MLFISTSSEQHIRPLAVYMLPVCIRFRLTFRQPTEAVERVLRDIFPINVQALQALACLPESESKESLKMMISYVLERLY